ncbi:MAG: glycosyltransferase, partial [Candidatus Sumerlaeia bacterium]|nr:glycosyltransferase [Candidatus Sumerlaeia bacterium]
MTKILAVGIGPLLAPGVTKVGGQCLRTWHLVHPLLSAGHNIRLFTIPIPDRDTDILTLPVIEEKTYKDFTYTQINRHSFEELSRILYAEVAEFSPDALLGINTFPASVLALLDTNIPFWADLNGYAMAEGQTKCRLYQNDAELEIFWRQELSIVRRADKFSVVSQPQKFALLGELALAGRLNRFTFDYEFVHWIPNAVNEMYLNLPDTNRRFLRGKLVPPEAFIVLWSGGFNTWTDVDFLYQALSKAMQANPRIHLVVAGGMVDGHDERTYPRFQQLVAESPFKERFHLCGWIPAEQTPYFFIESDLGINIDTINYETIFGARNRLTNMLAMGLPVLTTLGTEISHIIETERLGFTLPIGDLQEFVTTIIKAEQNRTQLKEIGARARACLLYTSDAADER